MDIRTKVIFLNTYPDQGLDHISDSLRGANHSNVGSQRRLIVFSVRYDFESGRIIEFKEHPDSRHLEKCIKDSD